MLLCCVFNAGEGIFTDAKGGVYEGGFHDNKRHGEGRQIYRYNNLTSEAYYICVSYLFCTCSNGDQYDGEWVLDKRHGQGLQRYSDGTIYDVNNDVITAMVYYKKILAVSREKNLLQ